MGTKPWLVVAEPELIKNIMIKDFNIFVNRRETQTDDPVLDRMISVAKDDDWKHLRSVVSSLIYCMIIILNIKIFLSSIDFADIFERKDEENA